MPILLVSVRFHDGRYHGSGEWPPSPARLFQALIAGAARGENLSGRAVEALAWLEKLEAPTIAAPSVYSGQGFKTFVPNNDLDAVGGCPSRINEIRVGKILRPRMFDTAVPLVYAWSFQLGADSESHARVICEMASHLYQLGRGVDMAWAQGEVRDAGEADTPLPAHDGILWHPAGDGGGTALSCPHPGSLASLKKRYAATRERFRRGQVGKKAVLLFSQAPKPDFRQVPYNCPPRFLLFDIRQGGAFAAHPMDGVVALTEKLRDLAAERLQTSAWRQDEPKRENCIARTFVGRDAKEADKSRRIRTTPLPSIGHAHTSRRIRRVLVTVPADCPIAVADIAWAYSGLALDLDPDTGEMPEDGAALVPADDRSMLGHYGIGSAGGAHLWRTVTPAALSERAARRRIDPHRIHEEAKDGSERVREQAAADWAVRQALRQAGIDTAVHAIRVRREPFEAKGQRAEVFAANSRFAKERLWHVEIAFARPVAGPVLIGDGRYLGLGLMAPVQTASGVFAFVIMNGLKDQAEPPALTHALRRAIMARVQTEIGERMNLPEFFTGHATDGAPARSGGHRHLAFAFDAPRRRLIIIAPHVLEQREALPSENKWLRCLAHALDGFCELRAGPAGRLSLLPCPIDQNDPVFGHSTSWDSLTPYCVTRHAKVDHAASALEADLLAECRRAGLPRPQIEVDATSADSRNGLTGRARLRFRGAVTGPILLGRDRHFGGGLFVAAK